MCYCDQLYHRVLLPPLSTLSSTLVIIFLARYSCTTILYNILSIEIDQIRTYHYPSSSSTNCEYLSDSRLSCGNNSPAVRNARDVEAKPKLVALLV
mmetsp:Transcript_23516/g.49661  ORF Transcript_23516/g.49661 Transcript_23516/m.49661 type:complete len:96 (-) Transcript_23516:1986-2273(-)